MVLPVIGTGGLGFEATTAAAEVQDQRYGGFINKKTMRARR